MIGQMFAVGTRVLCPLPRGRHRQPAHTAEGSFHGGVLRDDQPLTPGVVTDHDEDLNLCCVRFELSGVPGLYSAWFNPRSLVPDVAAARQERLSGLLGDPVPPES